MDLKTEQSYKILLTYNRRKEVVRKLKADCFQKQLDFIEDQGPLKAAQCTRRSGKSYGAGALYLSIICQENPGATCLYIATTIAQAKRIILKDCLHKINQKHKLGMTVNLADLTVKFPNGSVIYIMGLDSKPDEMEKALGQKYKLVVIDEGGSWRQDQRHLIHSVLEPACADLGGTICIIGSPVNNLKSYFFDITGRNLMDPQRAKGWSVHRWGWWDNPHIKEKMQTHVLRMKEANPLVVETPAFRQMYLNEWVVDPGARVYKFDDERNIGKVPSVDFQYYYALGLDLGYNDDTAIVIAAYSPNDPCMYFVDSFKKKGMDISAVSEVLKHYERAYRPYKWIVDGSSKQAVAELRNRYKFPLQPADRKGKAEMIEVMNGDFITGTIQVLTPSCQPLVDEYFNLIWSDKTTKREEHPACPNHLCDAALYVWRMCFHWASQDLELQPIPGSTEAIEQWWEREAVRAKKSKEHDFVVRDFGKEYGYTQ